jgi:nucleoside-diphosphate-sugar epimerase
VGDQIAPDWPPNADRDIGFTARQVGVSDAGVEIDAHLGMRCMKSDQGRSDEDLSDARRCRQADDAFRLGFGSIERNPEIADRAGHVFGGRDQLVACGSERDPGGRALEQHHTELVLESLEPTTYRRTIESDLQRGGRYPPGACDVEKHPHQIPVELFDPDPGAMTGNDGCAFSQGHVANMSVYKRFRKTHGGVMPSSKLHVVIGAGQIGPLVASRLLTRGHRVRLVRRGRFGDEVPTGAETANADIFDPVALDRAVADAAVIYHCANPAYTAWPTQLVPMNRAIIRAATGARAHLVVLDNLYMYGRAPAGVMREDTAVAPCSRKGRLRAEAAAALTAARDGGELTVTVGRASDFIGPGSIMTTAFGDRFWPRALAGKAGEVSGDPDLPHSYSFVADVADGLVTLGTDDRARNQLWHLPVNPVTSTRELMAMIGRALGHDLDATRVPPWLLRSLGWVWPLMREVAEMTYQWQAPFILDDSRYRATFGGAATPWPEIIAASVAWARAHYAAPTRAAA